jgi:hypothetical protein
MRWNLAWNGKPLFILRKRHVVVVVVPRIVGRESNIWKIFPASFKFVIDFPATELKQAHYGYYGLEIF